MSPLRNRLAAATLLCVVIDATTTGQQPVRVDPIPAVERFVQRTGLRARLTVAKSSVAAFEDPGFVARLDNVGSAPVRVNPNVESNLYIYDEHGRFVPPVTGFIAEFIVSVLNNRDVVTLRPGQTLGIWR